MAWAGGALKLEVAGEVATLTLNRPERRNALNEALWAALPDAIAAVEAEAAAKVLVLTGAGGHFAAGADIAEFEAVYATRARAAAYAATVTAGVEALASFSKPALARIQGACVGGGMALALACDLRLAAETARIGVTPGKLGLMYSLADTKRLVDAVGASGAKDMLFTGRLLDAGEALRLGALDVVVPTPELDATVAAKAAEIAAASQWSARKAKAIVRRILEGQADDDAVTRGWFLDAMEGEDFREGRDAFLSKRPARFPFR